MRPRRLLLQNIHSFVGTHEVDLSQISCAVLTGVNGSGKSTLSVDAILFALFGEVRGNSLDSIISYGEEVARVEYEFGLGEEIYLISRQRSRKGAGSTTLSFQRMTASGPEALDGKTISDTQARICEVTGLSADLIAATAVSGQNDASRFTRAKPTERKGILGSILGLDRYDQLAQLTRDEAKAVSADRGAKDSARQAAATTALTVPGIEEQIAVAAAEIDSLEARRDECAHIIEGISSEREETVRAQAADEAARKELRELAARKTSLAAYADRAKVRVENLEHQTKGAADTLTAIEQAEAAQSEAAEYEARRQERERLKGEASVLCEKIKGAKDRHAERIRTAEREVEASKREHAGQIKALRETIAALEEQAKLLDAVPCIDTPMAEKCPLIESAMRARTILPSKQQEIIALETQRPWAEQEKGLDALVPAQPWTAEAAAKTRLKAAYDAIEYDADAHAAVKAMAAKLPDLQKRLASMEAAREQLPDAEAALATVRADLKAVSERVDELAAQLGEARDWPSALTALDKRLRDTKEQWERVGRELDVARQHRGALHERLDVARKAAEQVAELEAEIASHDRRLHVLKVLGNPRDGAFSRGGIPALLIDQAVPELEASANEVLATLSDGQMALELRTQRENQSGSMSETLDLVVLDGAGERLYESFSGGERMRVDLALRVGLSKLLAHRADARCQMLVCDETCAPLDARGRAQFVEALGRLALAEDLTVLVVTHVDELKDAFPCQIAVTKDGDGSHVEVLR